MHKLHADIYRQAATKDGTKLPDIATWEKQQREKQKNAATTGQEIPGTKYDNYRVVVPADKKGGDILDVTLKNGKVVGNCLLTWAGRGPC